MHWGGRSLSHAGSNQLMLSAYDPLSKQPELKHAAVSIEPATLPYRVVALRAAEAAEAVGGDEGGEDEAEQVLRWRERLAANLADFDYAALTLAGRERPLLVLSIASAQPLPTTRLDELLAQLDMTDSTAYQDPGRAIVKRARIDNTDGALQGVLLAGETAAADWLREQMTSRQPLGELRRWLFAPVAQPPVAVAAAGRTVCNCFGVSESQILELLCAGTSLTQVQEQLKCGTSCGSCLPELRRMSAAHAGTGV
jgi:assimilatory nitrate reductase catalytic subunit